MKKLLSALIAIMFLTTPVTTVHAQEDSTPQMTKQQHPESFRKKRMGRKEQFEQRGQKGPKKGMKSKNRQGKNHNPQERINENYKKRVQKINERYSKVKAKITASKRPEEVKALQLKQITERRDFNLQHQKELKSLKESQASVLKSKIAEIKEAKKAQKQATTDTE